MMRWVLVALALAGCAAPVTAPAPTNSICLADSELRFSQPVIAAMDDRDLEAFVKHNRTWDALCLPRPHA